MIVDARSEVRTARTRLARFRAKARAYHDRLLPLQNQVVEQTQLQYNGMLVGVFQLLEARRDQIDVARGYIEALREYWIARADLEKAVGGSLPTVATTQPATNNQASGGVQ